MRSAAAVHVALLAGALAVDALAQLLACRLLPGLGWMRSILGGYAAGLAALALAEAAAAPALAQAAGERGWSILVVALTYTAAAFFWFNVIQGRKSALRVRLLRELRDAPGGLTGRELLERYPPEQMFEARLERLLGHGQIVERGGRWFVRRGPLWLIMRTMYFLKWLVLGKPGGGD